MRVLAKLGKDGTGRLLLSLKVTHTFLPLTSIHTTAEMQAHANISAFETLKLEVSPLQESGVCIFLHFGLKIIC